MANVIEQIRLELATDLSRLVRSFLGTIVALVISNCLVKEII